MDKPIENLSPDVNPSKPSETSWSNLKTRWVNIKKKYKKINWRSRKTLLLTAFLIILLVGAGALLYVLTNNNVGMTTSDETASEELNRSDSSPAGILHGKVTGGYYSKAISGVEISIKEFNDIKTKTNNEGEFTLSGIPMGSYNLELSHPDYAFDEQKIEIKDGENSFDKAIYGTLKNPKPFTVTGVSFSDKNQNGVKDEGETAVNALIYIDDSDNNIYKYVTPDVEGKFSLQITDLGKFTVRPGAHNEYTTLSSSEVISDGLGVTKTFNFAYVPIVSHAGFRVYVFNDTNENGTKDSGEGYMYYDNVRFTNTSGTSTRADGNTWRVIVPETGTTESPLDYGNYTVELAPADDSWSYFYKPTKPSVSVSVQISSGTQVIELGAHKLY